MVKDGSHAFVLEQLKPVSVANAALVMSYINSGLCLCSGFAVTFTVVRVWL